MGQVQSTICAELLYAANVDYWIYLGIALLYLVFLFFILPILILLAFILKNIKIIGIFSQLLIFMVRWFDLNATVYPTAIRVKPNNKFDYGKVINSDDVVDL